MLFCLRCKRLNSAGSSYCQGCNGTFGCRLCAKKKHVAAMTAQFCPVCGSDKLSTPVFYLPFGWLTRLIAWGLFGAVGWLLWRAVAGAVSGAASGAFGSSLPTVSSRALICLLENVISWLVCLSVLWLIVLSLLPPDIAKSLGKTLKTGANALGLLLRLVVAVIRLALVLIRMLLGFIQGNRRPPIEK